MQHWTEIRTAARVARLGTVSAAAESLGVHRATINRHVDTLEAALGGKLFQRHAKGFTPTDLGRELLRIADTADEQFEELHRKAQGQGDGLRGDFIVTSIATYAPTLMPILRAFGDKHPGLTIRFMVSDSLLRLEYGEAHVAFRAGGRPENPDNVVREFERIEIGLFAHQIYIDRHGLPNGATDFPKHRFAGTVDPNTRAGFQRWLHENVPAECIAFRSNSMGTLAEAVLCGNGIGFLPREAAFERGDLVEIVPPDPDWLSMMWMVTHVDLHRSAKVQAFLKELDHLRRTGDWL
ncbi:LysR family transcriptional regulator [Alphaproteobacteria bacterium AO1-B]|nr:LysR family transcriptional regulator [Alphaproteobacteria bacterium AO1-B]